MKAFECQKCGECCYGEGGIFIEPEEIEGIARFLGITSQELLLRFCQEKDGRIWVRTGSDGFCIFFNKEKNCLIHAVKPKTCSLWPFYPAIVRDKENWEMAKDACPGINRECSFEAFVKESEE